MNDRLERVARAICETFTGPNEAEDTGCAVPCAMCRRAAERAIAEMEAESEHS
jgi:bacterioferritin-associated ferredoxin